MHCALCPEWPGRWLMAAALLLSCSAAHSIRPQERHHRQSRIVPCTPLSDASVTQNTLGIATLKSLLLFTCSIAFNTVWPPTLWTRSIIPIPHTWKISLGSVSLLLLPGPHETPAPPPSLMLNLLQSPFPSSPYFSGPAPAAPLPLPSAAVFGTWPWAPVTGALLVAGAAAGGGGGGAAAGAGAGAAVVTDDGPGGVGVAIAAAVPLTEVAGGAPGTAGELEAAGLACTFNRRARFWSCCWLHAPRSLEGERNGQRLNIRLQFQG